MKHLTNAVKYYNYIQNPLQKFFLTDTAVKKIKQLIIKDQSILGIRILLKKSGCAGWSYFMSTVFKFVENDFIYEYKGIKICTPKKFLPLINKIELDYIKTGLNHKFVFNNPNVKNTCGCGKSINF
ncbi:MAG: Fe-S cluster assembly protein [Wigglesworthia glossinidia]|nr:Fe-S cluster assembly protein [Wigglesworthia glossinidia]